MKLGIKKMRNQRINNKLIILFSIISILIVLSLNIISSSTDFKGYSSSASYSSPSSYMTNYDTYYSSSDIQTYWPVLNDKDSCKARQDLILQVAPAGCQPAVVRSDLIAEQNVPVFCQINALKLNPLIDIKEINYIRFIGKYPKDVISAGFHPARAALRTRDKLLGSPLIDNIGYAVIILKKNEKESDLPDFVTVNLSGKIEYEAGNPLGIGRTEFILSEQNDESWFQEKDKQSFWNGRYFLRLERADPNTADISIYKGDNKISTIRVERGKVSNEIYLPGSYCQAGLQAYYDGFVAEEKRARIEITSDTGSEVIDVFKGSRILNNKCVVEGIYINKGNLGSEVLYIHDGKEEKATIKSIYDNDRYEIQTNNKKFTVTSESLKPLNPAVLGKTGKVQINCGYRDRIILQLKDFETSAIGKKVTYIPDGKEAIIQNFQSGKYVIQLTGPGAGEPFSVDPSEINFTEKILAEDKKLESPEAELAFQEAIKAYEDVADNYPAEKTDTATQQTFGEKALEAAITLSQANGKTQTEARLLNKLIDLYPLSENIEGYKKSLNKIYSVDSTLAGSLVFVDNKYKTLHLISLSDPINKAYAEFVIGTNPSPIKVEIKGETILSSSPSTRTSTRLEKIRLDYLNADEARITAFCNEMSSSSNTISSKTETQTFRISDSGKDICGQIVSLNKINISEVAKIRLEPLVRGTDSEVNLTVRIGIEKRALKLSPEKTEEMIENMNKSIEKWDSISKGLEKAVTRMKAACFATAAVLQAKTFITGLSGEGVARQNVMRGEKGWNVKCQEIVAKGQAANLNDCFLKNSAQINSDVKATSEAMKGINSKIKEIESPLKTSSGIFGSLGLESSVDRNESAHKYATYLTNAYKGQSVPGKDGKLVPIESLINSKDGYDKGEYTYDQLKQYELYLKLQSTTASDTIKKNYETEAKRTSEKIEKNKEYIQQFEEGKDLTKLGFAYPASIISERTQKVYTDVKEVNKLPNEVKEEFNKDKDITSSATFSVNAQDKGKQGKFEGGNYIAGLQKGQNNEYIVKKLIKVDSSGNIIQKDLNAGQFNSVYNIGTIIPQTSVSYNNRYQNPEIKYFETEPYKGMPAIVPFDTLRGWYAATKQNLPVFGGIGAFESSGRVASFYLCNIGNDGRERFQEGYGDDICELINLNTGQPISQFPGLDESQARALVGKAVNALTEAANQYKNSIVRIQGESFKVGKPALNIPATQCQDFMDPKDCYIMFNVCDPVICPASRCDFGGRYPVADVIQTGIVGSTLLCLPNIKEKIIVPVCLTGIQAGVDGYVSILKNHRDCLQENLATGRTVGICDQIYSIYACEFFWRQVAPVANVLLPKLVEVAYGASVPRGGGEYATVAGAWQNTQKSINYFTNTYAVNSLKAFQLRSIEEAGTPFCKAFVSAKAPNSFKSLIEPDSPPQFHAWFSSTKFNDATVPATAQYKVFYHIFAGKDSGIQYRVYLKGAPEGSYYYTSPILHIASGFITRGEYKSETKDFTAPEGYKELCVDINGEEKCGFKEVSTSFAINYLRDQYAKDQIEAKNIVSEKSCISGEASLGAVLANTNPQAAAEEAALPQVYNRGIVRICASQNPGSSTEPTRFADVGYCDDPKIRCWLDKNSINNAITENNKYLQNKTLSEINDIQRKALEDKALILPQDQANLQIDQFKREVSFIIAPNYENADAPSLLKMVIEAELKKINAAFGDSLEMLFFNHHKAPVLLMKAQLKAALADSYLRQGKKQEIKTSASPTTTIKNEFEVGDEVTYNGKSAIIQRIDGDNYIVQPGDGGEPKVVKRFDISLIIKEGTSETQAGPETGPGTDSERLVEDLKIGDSVTYNGEKGTVESIEGAKVKIKIGETGESKEVPISDIPAEAPISETQQNEETQADKTTEKNPDVYSLSFPYNPYEKRNIINYILLNGNKTTPETYISYNSIFLTKKLFQRFDYFSPDITFGKISVNEDRKTGKIILIPMDKSKMSEKDYKQIVNIKELYDQLNDATITGKNIKTKDEIKKEEEQKNKEQDSGEGFGQVAEPPSKSDIVP
ncbi:hypothetical protein HYW75_00610 [Candidatus Pacearchaeota archaeon]|nr:hypothetical protein [Candidatus Pacearchaeota archaeon]